MRTKMAGIDDADQLMHIYENALIQHQQYGNVLFNSNEISNKYGNIEISCWIHGRFC